jgi:hypothetical protein
MPRYFFTIHRQDRVENGPDGAYLPDAEAALSYADYTIRELRKKSGYEDDLSLMMIKLAREIESLAIGLGLRFVIGDSANDVSCVRL